MFQEPFLPLICCFIAGNYLALALVDRSGLLNNALVAANAAREISPKFVVIHFTMANIFAAMVSIKILSASILAKQHMRFFSVELQKRIRSSFKCETYRLI